MEQVEPRRRRVVPVLCTFAAGGQAGVVRASFERELLKLQRAARVLFGATAASGLTSRVHCGERGNLAGQARPQRAAAAGSCQLACAKLEPAAYYVTGCRQACAPITLLLAALTPHPTRPQHQLHDRKPLATTCCRVRAQLHARADARWFLPARMVSARL